MTWWWWLACPASRPGHTAVLTWTTCRAEGGRGSAARWAAAAGRRAQLKRHPYCGSFRGDTVEIIPPTKSWRFARVLRRRSEALFIRAPSLTGEVNPPGRLAADLSATHYVGPSGWRAVSAIEEELAELPAELVASGKLLEAQSGCDAHHHDIEMMRQWPGFAARVIPPHRR